MKLTHSCPTTAQSNGVDWVTALTWSIVALIAAGLSYSLLFLVASVVLS